MQPAPAIPPPIREKTLHLSHLWPIRLEAALELRHFVVHGGWVNGSFLKHPDTGEPFNFVSVKRRYWTEAPEEDTKAFIKSALKWLAREFWESEDELEKLHSEVLFGKGKAE